MLAAGAEPFLYAFALGNKYLAVYMDVNMDNIIEVKNVSFEYDIENRKIPILNDFSVEFKRGSFTVILGRNGSGKSTLAKLLNGLNKPSSGRVLVDKMDTSIPEYEIEIKRRVGMVFQNPDNQLIATIVEEDVAFGPENLGLPPEEMRKRVYGALKAVDMYDYRNHAPHKLSGGQKQRVAIAGIIAMEPRCLVLDEPTAMLDPKGRQEVMRVIRRLNKEKNITIILITHYMDEAVNADRVIVMDEGKIVLDGTPKAVFSQPKLIKKSGLDLPQPTELIFQLKKAGFDFDDGIISVDECVDAINKALTQEV